MDVDGNKYNLIQIGDQVWTAENLKVTHYRNGDPVPYVSSRSQWKNITSGVYCAYDNDENNADIYGYLYNWYALNDSRNIAPEGWHVPTDAEWKTMEMALGMSQSEVDGIEYRGIDEGSRLAGNADLWMDGDLENSGSFGASGFSALPGSFRNSDGDFHFPLGLLAFFWSASDSSSDMAWHYELGADDSRVWRRTYPMRAGCSVRLIRD